MIIAKIIMASGMAVGFLFMILGVFATIIGETKSFFSVFTIRLYFGLWFLAIITCLIWMPLLQEFVCLIQK